VEREHVTRRREMGKAVGLRSFASVTFLQLKKSVLEGREGLALKNGLLETKSSAIRYMVEPRDVPASNAVLGAAASRGMMVP
jgi:hypothetical protein